MFRGNELPPYSGSGTRNKKSELRVRNSIDILACVEAKREPIGAIRSATSVDLDKDCIYIGEEIGEGRRKIALLTSGKGTR
jgi:hypothetical protein